MKVQKYTLMALGTLASGMLVLGDAQSAPTGNVTITGRVPAACDIIVSAAATASNIDNIALGASDLEIATVNESCNDEDGYRVSVAGTNSGNHTGLFREPSIPATHPFHISYDGVVVPAGGIVTDSNNPAHNVSRQVTISYDPDPLLPPSAGFTYTETLVFTIGAK